MKPWLFFLSLWALTAFAEPNCPGLLYPSPAEFARLTLSSENARLFVHDAKWGGAAVIEVHFRRGRWVYAGLIHEASYVRAELSRRQLFRENRPRRDQLEAVAQQIYRRSRAEGGDLWHLFFLGDDLRRIFFVTDYGFRIFGEDGQSEETVRIAWTDSEQERMAGQGLLRRLTAEYVRLFLERDPRI